MALAYASARSPALAMPVSVSVESDAPRSDTHLGLALINLPGRNGLRIPATRRESTCSWTIERNWAADLILGGTPSALEGIRTLRVRVGERIWTFYPDDWRRQCPKCNDKSRVPLPPTWELRRISAPLPKPDSVWLICGELINYPGDAAIAWGTVRHPALVMLACCVALTLAGRAWLPRRLREGCVLDACLPAVEDPARPKSAASPVSRRAVPAFRSASWFLAGLLVLAACGVLLEVQQPYYFTEDDNYSQFLPSMLQGCRAAFAGESPEWNPHQLLGAPLAEVGTYALTYPPTYLSYGLATYILDDEAATIEVFCWLHLVGGYAACFWFGRRLGLAAPLASAMGLCLVLSGYALIAGRSWYYMTPTLVWVPLLGVSVIALNDRTPSWRWVLATGLIIGMFFHAGNAQMWAYGMGFFGLSLLWLWRSAAPRPRMLSAAAAVAIGLGLAAMLLVPQFLATRDLVRTGGGGHTIEHALHALFFPYPLSKGSYPPEWGNTNAAYRGQLYSAGCLFTLAWLLGLMSIWAFRVRPPLARKNLLLIFSVLAMVLCLGSPGVLWWLLARLPVFDKFSHPVKFLPFFHLFSLAIGAVIIQRATLRFARPRRCLTTAFAVVCVLVVYNAALCRSSFYSYGDRVYPKLPPELSEALCGHGKPVRVLPLVPIRSTVKNYALSLAHNFPSVYRIESLSGYDPLVTQRPEYVRVGESLEDDFAGAVRRYGVTHVLLHRTAEQPVLGENPRYLRMETEIPVWRDSVLTYCAEHPASTSIGDVRVIEVDDPDPLAFPVADRTRYLPVRQSRHGLVVDVSEVPAGSEVVVNYLWYRNVRLRADGKAIDSAPDAFGRIRARLPAGARQLTVRYQSPWHLGVGIGVGLIALGLIGHYLAQTVLARQGPSRTQRSRLTRRRRVDPLPPGHAEPPTIDAKTPGPESGPSQLTEPCKEAYAVSPDG